MSLFFLKKDFQPYKLDRRYSLKERFQGEALICFSLFSKTLEYTICSIKNDQIFIEASTIRISFETNLDLLNILEEIRKKYALTYCACEFQGGFEVMLLDKSLKNAYPSRQFEYSPVTLGSLFEKDRRYIHLSNNYTGKTLLFSFPRHHIDQLTDTMTKGGFILAKLGCGVFNLIHRYSYELKHTERSLNALLIIGRECVVLLKLEGPDWLEVSFRSVLDEVSAINTAINLMARLKIEENVGYYSNLNIDCSSKLSNASYVNLATAGSNVELMHNFCK